MVEEIRLDHAIRSVVTATLLPLCCVSMNEEIKLHRLMAPQTVV